MITVSNLVEKKEKTTQQILFVIVQLKTVLHGVYANN